MILSKDISKAVRRKRADKILTKVEASAEIGITRMTLHKVENIPEANVSQVVFNKLAEWLIQEEEINIKMLLKEEVK